MKQTAGQDNHTTDAFSSMQKSADVSTSEYNLISHSINSTTIRPLQEITSNYINLSDYSITSSPTSDHPCHKMPSCGAINFTYVNCLCNKCRDRANNGKHHYSCLYVDKEDIKFSRENDYEVINKESKEVSSDEEPLSSILEKLFEKYKDNSTNINPRGGYHTLQVVPSQTLLPFHFTTSSPLTMRNKLLD